MLNRRARYIVALEQLGSSDPTVRMSGVYALVWLVDEWMNTDDAPAAQCRQGGQAGGITVDPFNIQIMNKPASEDEEAIVNE